MQTVQTKLVSSRLSVLDWVLMIGLSLLWGGSFLFAKIAVSEIPPFSVVFARVLIAALMLAPVVAWVGGLPRGRTVWLTLFGMGLLNNVVPFSLIFWGQTQIGAGLASILNATTPLFTVLVAHALTTDEKLTAGKLAGVCIGLCGVAVMIGPELLQSLGTGAAAQLACLGAAISYAFSGVFGRRFNTLGISPLQTAAGQVMASSVMMAPVVVWMDRPWEMAVPSWGAIAAVLALAILSTALAYVLFFRILARAGATNVSLVTLLIPPSAIVLGAVFLGERLSASDFGGMALIAVGLTAIDGRIASRFRRPSQAL